MGHRVVHLLVTRLLVLHELSHGAHPGLIPPLHVRAGSCTSCLRPSLLLFSIASVDIRAAPLPCRPLREGRTLQEAHADGVIVLAVADRAVLHVEV